MPEVDIGALRAVAERLNPIGLNYAFTGGAVVNLLLDDPDFAPARPTKDVDVIVELVSGGDYSKVETALREAGFLNDVNGPICRWHLGKLIVDIMPTRGERYGLNTQWFAEALETSSILEYAHTELRVVSPLGLLVTKYLTFMERGEGDFFASHDLEDFITVIDGRAEVVSEINEASADFRSYLIQGIRSLMNDDGGCVRQEGATLDRSAGRGAVGPLFRQLPGQAGSFWASSNASNKRAVARLTSAPIAGVERKI